MTSFGTPPVASTTLRVQGRSPLAWALRRTALAIVILVVSIGGAAWLLYAAIDPDAEAAETRASLRTGTTIEDGGATASAGASAAVTTTGSVRR